MTAMAAPMMTKRTITEGEVMDIVGGVWGFLR